MFVFSQLQTTIGLVIFVLVLAWTLFGIQSKVNIVCGAVAKSSNPGCQKGKGGLETMPPCEICPQSVLDNYVLGLINR